MGELGSCDNSGKLFFYLVMEKIAKHEVCPVSWLMDHTQSYNIEYNEHFFWFYM